jgi:hypothetical protein
LKTFRRERGKTPTVRSFTPSGTFSFPRSPSAYFFAQPMQSKRPIRATGTSARAPSRLKPPPQSDAETLKDGKAPGTSRRRAGDHLLQRECPTKNCHGHLEHLCGKRIPGYGASVTARKVASELHRTSKPRRETFRVPLPGDRVIQEGREKRKGKLS